MAEQDGTPMRQGWTRPTNEESREQQIAELKNRQEVLLFHIMASSSAWGPGGYRYTFTDDDFEEMESALRLVGEIIGRQDVALRPELREPKVPKPKRNAPGFDQFLTKVLGEKAPTPRAKRRAPKSP